MLHEKILIDISKQLNVNQEAYLYTYILDNTPEIDTNRIRPIILVCPGGGYGFTSDREAEAIAVKFLSMGYHAAVLRYSVSPATYPTALMELAYTMNVIRENADAWHVDKDRIVVTGFSAGGHLVASLGMFWNRELIRNTLNISSDMVKPNALILCYPVITSGKYAHRDSFKNLLGERYDELVDEMSLENQVSEDTPPTFIWHTFEDGLVPVENALLLATALKKKNILTELHIYPRGGHGLSLATKETAYQNEFSIQEDCANWIDLANTWIKNL
ncbi:MAG TPA: alpha/beta hydrolase [Lachnospiraceae bacterium]|nr:alpha/beta hydrolase [Lachnospiraceae bacterium]